MIRNPAQKMYLKKLKKKWFKDMGRPVVVINSKKIKSNLHNPALPASIISDSILTSSTDSKQYFADETDSEHASDSN